MCDRNWLGFVEVVWIELIHRIEMNSVEVVGRFCLNSNWASFFPLKLFVCKVDMIH